MLLSTQTMAFYSSPVIKRVIFFIVLFLIISGLSGSWLISTRQLLFPFYFHIYGGAGKVILFGLVTFLLMTKDKILQLPIKPLTLTHYLTLIGSFLSLIVFFFLANDLRQFHTFSQVPYLTMATHAALWASGGGIALGVFGFEFILKAIKTFWKAALISLILATSFYVSFSTIFKLWPYLSAIVLWAVSRMLALTQDSVVIVPPLTIQLREFSVTIGEYCSGIESLFLISALYILIGCLERERVRLIRFILAFFPLLVGMFSLNIIRVYGIILAGLMFGPEIAAKLFHTYLGMILFLTYFFLFWKFSASSLLLPSRDLEKKII